MFLANLSAQKVKKIKVILLVVPKEAKVKMNDGSLPLWPTTLVAGLFLSTKHIFAASTKL